VSLIKPLLLVITSFANQKMVCVFVAKQYCSSFCCLLFTQYPTTKSWCSILATGLAGSTKSIHVPETFKIMETAREYCTAYKYNTWHCMFYCKQWLPFEIYRSDVIKCVTCLNSHMQRFSGYVKYSRLSNHQTHLPTVELECHLIE